MIENIFSFSLNLWLGAYLLSRDLRSWRLRLAGVSLIIYAVAIALNLLDLLQNLSSLPIGSAVLWACAAYLFMRSSVRYRLLVLLALPAFLLSSFISSVIISVVLCVAGITAAAIDATERDEALIPDLLRSFDYSAFMAVVFGGQVVIVMNISGVSTPLTALLLGTIAASVTVQAFSEYAQRLVDRVAFFRWARLRMARAELRAVANAMPRATETTTLDQMGDEEFVRHTRRALSHFGDLPHLASNPLIYLPAIDTRLAQRHASDNTLERAVELKTLLSESVARLKPRDKGDFGTTNEWRHYNALYYPYVVGVKPYSVRAAHDQLDDEADEALRWFNASVPERTLYNWQSAATKLVAQDLRERQKETNGSVWQQIT